MKTTIRTAACIIGLLVASAAFAQDRQDRQDRTQFNDHDRQVTQDWYKGHQNTRGLRAQDRLSSDQESRLQEGRPFDRDMRKRSYAVPSDLRRHLPPAPARHRYVTIGGHVVLVDSGNVVRGIIHVHR
jgi:Ni/Co efflux regulator RcnB